MENILIVTLVIALVELARRVKARDWETVFIILGAGAIGGGIGYLKLHGISIEEGILTGLSASGFVNVAKRIGGDR